MDTGVVAGKGGIGFHNITKKYGELTVVDDISLDIRPGEFFSLLGPSGSGKTTTLMMLAGFAIPDSGRIMLDSTDISRLSPQERNLGMVFQNYALFPHMTVLENVMFPLKVRKYTSKACHERARWAIDLVRLSDYARRLPKELSGGQQQRVALARAVVFHPEVVLMDEPLGALDKNLRYQMQMEIKELQRQLNMTVVFVTHDQEEAMNMSDRIAIMNNGRIEQLGDPKAVYESPDNVFTAGFLGEANILSYGDLEPAYRRHAGLKEGECLFVRPERVVLTRRESDGGEASPELRGQVLSVSFLGNIVRYQVGVNERIRLYADAANLADMPVFRVGDRVSLGWKHAGDAKVIPHE